MGSLTTSECPLPALSPTETQRCALTDKQCIRLHQILNTRYPDEIRPHKVWELHFRPAMTRVYTARRRFNDMKRELQRLDWSYETLLNRFQEYHIPARYPEPDENISQLSASVSESTPPTAALPLTPKDKSRTRHKRTYNTGCLLCRKKKIKCDTSKPSCKSCKTRNVMCEYPPKNTPRRTNSKAGTPYLVYKRADGTMARKEVSAETWMDAD